MLKITNPLKGTRLGKFMLKTYCMTIAIGATLVVLIYII